VRRDDEDDGQTDYESTGTKGVAAKDSTHDEPFLSTGRSPAQQLSRGPWAPSSHAAPSLFKKTGLRKKRAWRKKWGSARPRPESTTLLLASEQVTDLHGRRARVRHAGSACGRRLGGWAAGGSLAHLASFRVRAWPLLVVAVVLEGSLGLAHGPVRTVLAVAACLVVVAWCALNGSRTGRFPTARP